MCLTSYCLLKEKGRRGNLRAEHTLRKKEDEERQKTHCRVTSDFEKQHEVLVTLVNLRFPAFPHIQNIQNVQNTLLLRLAYDFSVVQEYISPSISPSFQIPLSELFHVLMSLFEFKSVCSEAILLSASGW